MYALTGSNVHWRDQFALEIPFPFHYMLYMQLTIPLLVICSYLKTFLGSFFMKKRKSSTYLLLKQVNKTKGKRGVGGLKGK